MIVLGKECPKPFVDNPSAWTEFKTRVERLFHMKEIKNVKDALDFLEENERITDRMYWEKAIFTTRNVDFLLIKWANDVLALTLK